MSEQHKQPVFDHAHTVEKLLGIFGEFRNIAVAMAASPQYTFTPQERWKREADVVMYEGCIEELQALQDFVKQASTEPKAEDKAVEDYGKIAAEALRPIRLWHWKQVGIRRNYAALAFSQKERNVHNAKANQHMKFVQQLNDFFPAGDTAEQDAKK